MNAAHGAIQSCCCEPVLCPDGPCTPAQAAAMTQALQAFIGQTIHIKAHVSTRFKVPVGWWGVETWPTPYDIRLDLSFDGPVQIVQWNTLSGVKLASSEPFHAHVHGTAVGPDLSDLQSPVPVNEQYEVPFASPFASSFSLMAGFTQLLVFGPPGSPFDAGCLRIQFRTGPSAFIYTPSGIKITPPLQGLTGISIPHGFGATCAPGSSPPFVGDWKLPHILLYAGSAWYTWIEDVAPTWEPDKVQIAGAQSLSRMSGQPSNTYSVLSSSVSISQ